MKSCPPTKRTTNHFEENANRVLESPEPPTGTSPGNFPWKLYLEFLLELLPGTCPWDVRLEALSDVSYHDLMHAPL